MPNCNDPITQFTPGDLVQFLKNEIPEYLGTYTYPEGYTTDAISVGTVPNEVEVDGFEVILPVYPRLSGGVYKTRRTTHIEQLWTLDFINHDSDKTGSLARKGEFFMMIQKIVLLLPRTVSGLPVSQSDPTRSLQRYQLTIKHSDLYQNIRANTI